MSRYTKKDSRRLSFLVSFFFSLNSFAKIFFLYYYITLVPIYLHASYSAKRSSLLLLYLLYFSHYETDTYTIHRNSVWVEKNFLNLQQIVYLSHSTRIIFMYVRSFKRWQDFPLFEHCLHFTHKQKRLL